VNKSTKPKPQKAQRPTRVTKVASTSPGNAKHWPGMSQTAKTSSTHQVREGSKLAAMITLLRWREGATIDQMMKTTGWQAHSVRGAMSGTLKKKLGLTITSSKTGGTRTYRISAASAV